MQGNYSSECWADFRRLGGWAAQCGPNVYRWVDGKGLACGVFDGGMEMEGEGPIGLGVVV